MSNGKLKKNEEHVNNLVTANTEVVFVIGKPASGKTTLLITLIDYMRKSLEDYAVTLNPLGNPEGILYIEGALEELNDIGKLPSATKKGEILSIDVEVNYSEGKRKVLTFVDVAGEDLELSFNEKQGSLELKDVIHPYFNSSKIKTTFLFLIDGHNPSGNDIAHQKLISYFKNVNNENVFEKAAIIITKRDLISSSPIKEFVSDNAPQTVAHLEKFYKEKACFLYSIGSVDGQYVNNEVNTKYCSDIIEWLLSGENTDSNTLKPDNTYAKDIGKLFIKVFGASVTSSSYES